MTQLAEDMTDAALAGPNDSQVVHPAGRNVVAGPEVLRIRIQLYFRGRSDVVQNYQMFVDFISQQLGHLRDDWAFDENEPPRLGHSDEGFPMVQVFQASMPLLYLREYPRCLC